MRGFRAPPMSVPRLPIEHPYAMENIHTFPKLLSPGRSLIAVKIESPIGKNNAAAVILAMLKRLEYRGYDSAGIATINKANISIIKCKGRIRDLESLLHKRRSAATVGIGHTRWATHGKPSKINAHPHTDCSGKITVVHNGIIENFAELKQELQLDGCKFRSQTDTEVIVHLISKLYSGNLEQAVRRAIKRIKSLRIIL